LFAELNTHGELGKARLRGAKNRSTREPEPGNAGGGMTAHIKPLPPEGFLVSKKVLGVFFGALRRKTRKK